LKGERKMKKIIKRVLFISVFGLSMSVNSLYAIDAGLNCKTSLNVSEATLSTPDETYTMFFKGKYTGSSDAYVYSMRIRDTGELSGPILVKGSISAGRKNNEIHYNSEYKINSKTHSHTYVRYVN